jgi:uncharacterized protein YegP (UPF0339 family)
MPDTFFEWYKDRQGKFILRLIDSAGNIVVISKPFKSKEELFQAIERIKNTVPEAKTREITFQEVARDVKEIKETQFRQEKHSNISFYFGVLLGGLLGVVGNFFVSYWVMNPQNIIGLIISGVLLIFMFMVLLCQARKYVDEASGTFSQQAIA